MVNDFRKGDEMRLDTDSAPNVDNNRQFFNPIFCMAVDNSYLTRTGRGITFGPLPEGLFLLVGLAR